jgi:hypothetical protein
MTTDSTPTTGDSQSPQKAPTLDALTTALQGKTITQGWDVVHAMSADKVNDLLQRQFVTNVVKSSNLPPVEGKVPIAYTNLSVELVDLVLGSPLITFDPQHASGTASISIPVVSGVAHMLATTGPETTVLATQWISYSAGYVITGQVPLGAVEGLVEDGHDVVLDIEDGSGFEADLGLPGATGTLLGTYLLSFIRQHATGYRYSLGTIIYSTDPGLVPAGEFKIATQVDATDPTDKGRVLLFIPTTYNPDGGTQTVLELPNVVPAGMDTTLLIASATTFGKLISAAVGSTFGGAVSAVKLSTGASSLTSTGGSVDSLVKGDNPDNWGSGICLRGDRSAQPEHVVVPLAGVTFSPSSDGKSISASWDSSWSQNYFHFYQDPDMGEVCEDGQFTMSAKFSGATYTPSVDKKDGTTVRFNSPGQVTVIPPPKETKWEWFWDLGIKDTAVETIHDAVSKELVNIFKFTLPEVQAFAVSSLLFPSGKSSFSEARVPGDLMLCGTLVDADLSVNPALQVIEAGGTAKCEANTESVTWLPPKLGTIDDDGNYTAPASIARDTLVTITATLGTGANKLTAYAAILVVPAKVLVSPLITVTQPQYAPQQFEASLPGSTDKPKWSLLPKLGLGTIDDDGNYTPPDTLSEPTVVSVTATLGAATGAATVLITPQAPGGVAVEPYATDPLRPNTEQSFAAKAGNQSIKPTWSLWPPGRGSIDEGTGLYSAPQTIDAPQGVVLMATDPSDSTLTGTAVILLSPAD